MVMTACIEMNDTILHERLPALWRRIEDAHYSYLETDDSPEKLQQKKKLEDYIIEYLSLVPHECKFGLSETGKVFQRTIKELPEFSAYRAGLGWAALGRYASNLLAQPWRKEYKIIRLYCGYFKHEVQANMVGAEILLQAMGYKPAGAGRLSLDAPVCPDMVAAVSRDAIIAQCECQIMAHIWESAWGQGVRLTWEDVARERAKRASSASTATSRLAVPDQPSRIPYSNGSETYSNIPVTVTDFSPTHHKFHSTNVPQCSHMCSEETILEDPITPLIHPYMMTPNVMQQQIMYPHQNMHAEIPVTVTNQIMMNPYGVPCYYPVQTPYMIPTTVYSPIKHATNIPINGYPMQYNRYPPVPTAQLIELDASSTYENGKFDRHRDDERGYRKSRQAESSRRNSTSKSGFSEVSLPSLPRSDTQPTLSKAKEDGMGTYESWDYVFRNLSSKDHDEDRNRYSPSLDRDSRTLDRLDKEERRAKYQPTTLDLEDGLQALNIDRSYDEDAYRTAKVNENLMRMKQEQELKRAKQLAKKQADERKLKKLEPIGNPKSDALIPTKVAVDKVKLLTKKEIQDRKDIIKQQNSVNGTASTAELRKVKKPSKQVATELERPVRSKPLENGVRSNSHSSKSNIIIPPDYEHKPQLVVSLDQPDFARQSSPKAKNSELDKWECGTCTFINGNSVSACEMCGKSKRGPEIQPLTSGGRECPTCTLVNKRDATVCDACSTSLEHCPTYI
ncbi:hypothetical protein ACJJTC_007200 [Scirpophaga incertulas]